MLKYKAVCKLGIFYWHDILYENKESGDIKEETYKPRMNIWFGFLLGNLFRNYSSIFNFSLDRRLKENLLGNNHTQNV